MGTDDLGVSFKFLDREVDNETSATSFAKILICRHIFLLFQFIEFIVSAGSTELSINIYHKII
jgi:hypothetical protein